MHDKGEVSLIEASPWINPLFTVQKRVEREREMGIGCWDGGWKSRSEVICQWSEACRKSSFSESMESIHLDRERERVNDGSCLISRRILGARGWKAVDEGQFATIMTIPRRLGELLPTFKALAESKWGLQVLRDEDT